MTYPPVLVPPMRSKTSQGLGGLSGSISLKMALRIKRVERLRTPPPSDSRSENWCLLAVCKLTEAQQADMATLFRHD